MFSVCVHVCMNVCSEAEEDICVLCVPMCMYVCTQRQRRTSVSFTALCLIPRGTASSEPGVHVLSASMAASKPQQFCLHGYKPVLWLQAHTRPCLAFYVGSGILTHVLWLYNKLHEPLSCLPSSWDYVFISLLTLFHSWCRSVAVSTLWSLTASVW